MKNSTILGRMLVAVAVLALVQKFVLPLGAQMLAQIFPDILIDSTNRDRALMKLSRLTIDPQLMEAARAKAESMAQEGYFAHTSPDGKTPWYWIDQSGYPFLYAGENLALNFEDSEEVETAWMESESHRANILDTEFQDIGVGLATGTWNGVEGTVVVQLFGRKAEN